MSVRDEIEHEAIFLSRIGAPHCTVDDARTALERIARLAATEAASEAAQHYGVPSGYMGALASIVAKVLGEGGAT